MSSGYGSVSGLRGDRGGKEGEDPQLADRQRSVRVRQERDERGEDPNAGYDSSQSDVYSSARCF